MSTFQTDALRPSSLPTASLGRRRPLDGNGNTQTAVSEDLDKVAEEWNVRIDKEMKSMTTSLAELVDLADVSRSYALHSLCDLNISRGWRLGVSPWHRLISVFRVTKQELTW
jgi:hypothetical protein